MNSLRNHKTPTHSQEPCAEAFEYDDDVTAEAVEVLRERAKSIFKNGKWKVIEGHGVGK